VPDSAKLDTTGGSSGVVCGPVVMAVSLPFPEPVVWTPVDGAGSSPPALQPAKIAAAATDERINILDRIRPPQVVMAKSETGKRDSSLASLARNCSRIASTRNDTWVYL
jgi:hypothetical protein